MDLGTLGVLVGLDPLDTLNRRHDGICGCLYSNTKVPDHRQQSVTASMLLSCVQFSRRRAGPYLEVLGGPSPRPHQGPRAGCWARPSLPSALWLQGCRGFQIHPALMVEWERNTYRDQSVHYGSSPKRCAAQGRAGATLILLYIGMGSWRPAGRPRSVRPADDLKCNKKTIIAYICKFIFIFAENSIQENRTSQSR